MEEVTLVRPKVGLLVCLFFTLIQQNNGPYPGTLQRRTQHHPKADDQLLGVPQNLHSGLPYFTLCLFHSLDKPWASGAGVWLGNYNASGVDHFPIRELGSSSSSTSDSCWCVSWSATVMAQVNCVRVTPKGDLHWVLARNFSPAQFLMLQAFGEGTSRWEPFHLCCLFQNKT